ncbi:MAG: dienelactone hydrolase family protein [Terriglobales bacterium]
MPSRFPPSGPVAVVAILFLAAVDSAQTSLPWRYDLRPGDHLIYQYTFQRQTQSQEDRSRTEAHFQTHVLVVGESAESISLGFQRNRETAELTEYFSKGKDRLAKERVEFQKRMQKRPSRFSEAMEISPAGKPRYSWEVARESYSHLLGVLHEVMNLPPIVVAKGETWRDSTVAGMDFRWVNDESIHGKLCRHIEGAMADGSLKLSYWWSPESGVLEQVALDGNYSLYGGTAHETARMELQSRVRGEQIANWLDSADTRQGALQALLLTPGTPISSEQLSPALTSDEPASRALALAVASRHKIEVPPGILGKLRQSASGAVATQLEQSQLRLLGEDSSNSGNPPTIVDECHRALASKSPPAKFGTIIEVTAATKDNPQMPYLLRIPLTYREDRPSPLLVYLSGGAGLAIDGVNAADDIVSQTDYLVLYPQSAGYWWTPEAARRFDAVFNDVVQRYNVDRDRVYVTGFSNGGTGALYFASLWPQRFAAVVSLMGAGLCIDQIKAGLPNLKNLPLLFVHGENDPIIDPECSKSTQSALIDLHPAIEPQLKILPDRGHDITLETDDGLALAFFKDKLRNPFPRSVDLVEFDVLAARGYWVEILDGKPGKSDIDARVKPDNTFDIHSHDVKSIRLHLRPELLPKPGDLRVVWNGKKIFSGALRDYCSLLPVSPGDPKLDYADTRDLTLP